MSAEQLSDGPGSVLEGFVRYAVYQKERGSETGYDHWQVYMELKKPVRLAALKKLFHSGHYEKRRGTREEARAYCMKEDTRIEGPYEIGTWEAGGQGTRTDFQEIYQMLSDRKSLLSVLEAHPGTYMRAHRGIKDAKFLIEQKASMRFRSLKTTVIVGDAGTGKTRLIYDLHGFESVFKLDPQETTVWFDGYGGEDILLIDDFYGWIRWGMLLNILDGYPLRLPVKGGFCWANWTKVYITSNNKVESWYDRGCPPELKRRITGILRMKNL